MKKIKLLMFVPYTMQPVNNGARIRAHNMYHALKEIADVTLISRPAYNFIPEVPKLIYLNFLLSLFGQVSSEMIQLIKNREIDYVYIEAFATPLHSFDYLFLNTLKKRNIPIFPFINDLYWKYSEILGLKRNKRADEYGQREYDWYIRNATALLFPSKTMADTIDFLDKYSLPSAGDPSIYFNQKLPDNKNIVYIGELTPAMGIYILMKAMKIVVKEHPDAHFTIVGQGSKEITNKLKNKDYVTFIADKTYKDIPNILSNSYATVIPRQINPYTNFSMPVKLFDYMSSGRPIITTNCAAQANFIKENDCGVVTEDNPESIAEGILKLLENRELATRYGKNAFSAIKNKHSWERRAKELIRIMKKY